MIYIYDILLNFMDSRNCLEFFEWDQNDDIEHVKKIPLFRVSKEMMKAVYGGDVILKEGLSEIKDRTEIFGRDDVRFVPYACLFSDGRHCMAVEFDETGKSVYKSGLLLDEEEEILDIADRLDERTFSYQVLESDRKKEFLTRREKKICIFLRHEIEDAYKKNDCSKLQYLYAEYGGVEESDMNAVYRHLVESLDQFLDDRHYRLYHLLKLSHSNKK